MESTFQLIRFFLNLPLGLFRSEDANSNKLISRCYHRTNGTQYSFLQVPEKQNKASGDNGDRDEASNSKRTEVRWRFSELLSDGSQICLKTSEITSTKLTIWIYRTCRWAQIWRICSYYEFTRECKFILFWVNQNITLNLLLKHSAKPTNGNSQSILQKRDKINIQLKEFSTPA